MDYQLVVIKGRSASTAVKLADGVTSAGRGEDCQLRIKSSQVSRKHCELFEKHGMLLVKDLGSSNGTFVNGSKIEGQRVMEPGDELGIGPIVFRVEKIGEPAPAKRAATAAKPSGDTAIVEAITADDAIPDDEFEIDFDDEPAAPAVTVDFDEEAIAAAALGTSEPPPKPPAAAPEKKAPPGLAASTKPPAAKPVPPPEPPKDESAGMADDAIADFLLDIKLDDED